MFITSKEHSVSRPRSTTGWWRTRRAREHHPSALIVWRLLCWPIAMLQRRADSIGAGIRWVVLMQTLASSLVAVPMATSCRRKVHLMAAGRQGRPVCLATNARCASALSVRMSPRRAPRESLGLPFCSTESLQGLQGQGLRPQRNKALLCWTLQLQDDSSWPRGTKTAAGASN